jgi:hypothetical protein
MRSIILLLLVSISYSLFAQDTFQLAPPLLKYNSVFFSGKTMVEIKFAQSGTAVHFTLNNRTPSVQDPVYTKPIPVKNNFTTLKAGAFGNNYRPSETAAVTFIKEGKAVQSIQQTTPNEKYPGNGANTLIDNKGGVEQLSSTTWMGYLCDTVTVAMNMYKKQRVGSVLINFLQNESSWIFLPDEVIVYWFDKKSGSFQLFGKEKLTADIETPGSRCSYRIVKTESKRKTNKILISILVKKSIPAWHAAKGEHAWMFIDEIKVY